MTVDGEIGEALGEIAVLGGERRFDLAFRHFGIEFLVEHAAGDFGRVVLDAQEILRIEAARHRVHGERRKQCDEQHDRRDTAARRDEAVPQFLRCQTSLLWRESLRVSHGSRLLHSPLSVSLGITLAVPVSLKKMLSNQWGSGSLADRANEPSQLGTRPMPRYGAAHKSLSKRLFSWRNTSSPISTTIRACR